MCNAVFFFCAVIPACHLRCLAQCLCPATAGCEHLHFFPSFLVHRVVIWYMCSSSIRPWSSSSSAIPPPSSSSRLRSPFASGFSHGTRVQDVGKRRLRARAGHLRSNHVHVFHVEGPAASNFTSCAHVIDRSVVASAWNVTAGARAATRNPLPSQTFAKTRAIHPRTNDWHVQSAFQSSFELLDSPWLAFLFFFSFRLAPQLSVRRNGVCSSANHVQARILAHESPPNTFVDAKDDLNSRRSRGTCSAAAAGGEPAGFRHRFAHRPPFVPLFFSRVEVPCLPMHRFGFPLAFARGGRRCSRALHAPRLQVDAWPSCDSSDVAHACAPLRPCHVGRRGALEVHERVNQGIPPDGTGGHERYRGGRSGPLLAVAGGWNQRVEAAREWRRHLWDKGARVTKRMDRHEA